MGLEDCPICGQAHASREVFRCEGCGAVMCSAVVSTLTRNKEWLYCHFPGGVEAEVVPERYKGRYRGPAFGPYDACGPVVHADPVVRK